MSKIEGDIVMKKKGKVEQEGSDISLRREKVFGEDVSRLLMATIEEVLTLLLYKVLSKPLFCVL